MTTTIKVHVNGEYRATVVQTDADGTERAPVFVESNSERSFHLAHPASATFKITEEANVKPQPEPNGVTTTATSATGTNAPGVPNLATDPNIAPEDPLPPG